MKKPLINFTINTIMAVCMSAIIGIGFLIKFNLIPGQERRSVYGKNVELTLFGMDRHQWGTLHLIIGFVLIGLLTVHIFLHWHIITSVYEKLIKEPLTKKMIAFVFALICLLLIIIPFFLNPKVEPIKTNWRQQVTLVTQI